MSSVFLHLSDLPSTLAWLRARAPQGQLRTDSRHVQPGDIFIAWPGAAVDGRAFVAQALAHGAAACLVEHDGSADFAFADARIASFTGLKAITGSLAAQWLGHPAQALRIVAVTGTNGKTSTAWWLAHALPRCAMVGTLGVGLPPHFTSTGMTTPDPVLLQTEFAKFIAAGAEFAAIEASSIGIVEHRLAGTAIDTAVFTNFTQDHLDYHGSMDAYWQAKAQLFDWPGLRVAVVNVDDAQGRALAQTLAPRCALEVWTVGLQHPARLMAVDIAHTAQGMAFTVVEGQQRQPMQTALIGQYNISNLLGVLATLRGQGHSLAQAVAACASLQPVPGRMQQIAVVGQPLVAIDYAHTPDALVQALAALRPLAQARGGRLCCVFGCGGNRDARKRPLMGAAAEQGADQVLVTSDNPRLEDPQAIVADILAGMRPQTPYELDRAAAIAQAIAQADARDVVLLAGKGHEDYQDAQGHKRPFSDYHEAARAVQARQERTQP
ncbi:MAG: UDP-N-acetylmuramoyl-L-alanyl-D-glutamate--2,6-diaminopimelate ligase [Comamonas sp.]|nr:UDP-N-acetylmuramoyl-L-alanyl-D-glutamate--2,6-diaminopimelate ligase [Comamonas sp.]MBP7977786.1 UDP-N-acetylmuramoyl-L-alanyl-D-glutamate--2,6-diaminopimelate ligase [Comamonas sp.]